MDGTIERRIVLGTQWAMPKDGPWGGHFPEVTVLDVAEGWVRYAMGEVFPDCRMEEAAFVLLYKPLASFERGALQ